MPEDNSTFWDFSASILELRSWTTGDRDDEDNDDDDGDDNDADTIFVEGDVLCPLSARWLLPLFVGKFVSLRFIGLGLLNGSRVQMELLALFPSL